MHLISVQGKQDINNEWFQNWGKGESTPIKRLQRRDGTGHIEEGVNGEMQEWQTEKWQKHVRTALKKSEDVFLLALVTFLISGTKDLPLMN